MRHMRRQLRQYCLVPGATDAGETGTGWYPARPEPPYRYWKFVFGVMFSSVS